MARPSTRVLDELLNAEGVIDLEAWSRAHVDRTQVARCRCGGPVVTDPVEPAIKVFHGVRWYSTRCTVCAGETEIPGHRKFSTEVARPSKAGTTAVLQRDRRRLAETL
jgi:hypothetical protein